MNDPDKVDEALEYYGGVDSRAGILAAEVERWRELHEALEYCGGADSRGGILAAVINLERGTANAIRAKDLEIDRLRSDKDLLEGEVGSLGLWIEKLKAALRKVQWYDTVGGTPPGSSYHECTGCGTMQGSDHDADCPIENALNESGEATPA